MGCAWSGESQGTAPIPGGLNDSRSHLAKFGTSLMKAKSTPWVFPEVDEIGWKVSSQRVRVAWSSEHGF
jgi:hypothetical protein